MFLTFTFFEDPLNPIAAGYEARNNYVLERIDAARRGGNLRSQAAQPDFAGGNLQHEIDAGFEPLGDVVDTRSRGGETVSAGTERPPYRSMLDTRNPNAHDRAHLGIDLYMTGGRERRGSYRLRTVSSPGPIKRYPGGGAGFLKSIAAGQDLPDGGAELRHELFALVLEKIATVFGKSDLGPTGQQLSASRATLIHGESPRPSQYAAWHTVEQGALDLQSNRTRRCGRPSCDTPPRTTRHGPDIWEGTHPFRYRRPDFETSYERLERSAPYERSVRRVLDSTHARSMVTLAAGLCRGYFLQIADQFGNLVIDRVSTGILVDGHVEPRLRKPQRQELAGIDGAEDSVIQLSDAFEIGPDRTGRIALGEPRTLLRGIGDTTWPGASSWPVASCSEPQTVLRCLSEGDLRSVAATVGRRTPGERQRAPHRDTFPATGAARRQHE